MAPSQRVVATCRLPWLFKVGKRKRIQGAPAAPAGSNVPGKDEAGGPSGQHPMAVGTPTPLACVRAELGVPTVEPLIQSSPESSLPPEGGHQGVLFVPSAQAPAARGPGAQEVVRPTQRKQGRAEAGLDDEDSQNIIVERHVRPRPEQWNGAHSTGPVGPSASPAYHFRSRPITTATDPGVTQRTTPHGISSSNSSSNSPATSANAIATTAAPTASQPDPPLRSERYQISARPDEPTTAVLRSTNPRTGPVSGGIEIWLGVDDLPTTFTLYARFGTQVAATVGPIFHSLSLI
jgi:hypothetical protein